MSNPISRIFDGGALRQLAASAPLFHRGDPVRRMHFVIEGLVVLARQTEAGAAVAL